MGFRRTKKYTKLFLKKLFEFHISEVQAFVVGILATLLIFGTYIFFFSPYPSLLLTDELKREEKQLQGMIQDTDQLLEELSATIKKNKMILDQIADSEGI